MSENQDMVFANEMGNCFVWNPSGITCAMFTYGWSHSDGVIVKFVPNHLIWLNAMVFVFLVFLAITSHFEAMTTNPVSAIGQICAGSA